jgi:hypothetical protein
MIDVKSNMPDYEEVNVVVMVSGTVGDGVAELFCSWGFVVSGGGNVGMWE